jgi:hypothetical protein
MKTALTELIEKWDSEMGSYIPNVPIYQAFIQEAKLFLEKEKEQIEDAYFDAMIEPNMWKASSYYESKYKK